MHIALVELFSPTNISSCSTLYTTLWEFAPYTTASIASIIAGGQFSEYIKLKKKVTVEYIKLKK
jgi:hypothetical protein